MKKIDQGRYELFATKKEVIDRFMQLQGLCREGLEDESAVVFSCRKDGTISIFEPPSRSDRRNPIRLSARIIEKEGKTFLTYYTSFNKAINIVNLICCAFSLLLLISSIVYAIINRVIGIHLLIFLVLLVISLWSFFAIESQEKDAYSNSKIMVNELEERVEAVNLWDK